MQIPDMTERIRLLQMELHQVWQQAQRAGSGATVHTLINRISTARGALSLLAERQTWDSEDHLAVLLELVEASLQEARVLIAQTTGGRINRAWATRDMVNGEGTNP